MAIFFEESRGPADAILQHPGRLRILCEGDSWFALPMRLDAVRQIGRMGGFTILDPATNGEEPQPGSKGVRKIAEKFKPELDQALPAKAAPRRIVSLPMASFHVPGENARGCLAGVCRDGHANSAISFEGFLPREA